MANLAWNNQLVALFDEEDITASDVETALAEILYNVGYVRDTYVQAILDREAVYPTALEVGALNIAIPHCDVEHVKEGALCVGVLKHPVPWRRMDAPDCDAPVSFVVMLALNEAHAHLEMLQKVIGIAQDSELMERVVAASNKDEVYELLVGKLA